jgi:hypothetical protein
VFGDRQTGVYLYSKLVEERVAFVRAGRKDLVQRAAFVAVEQDASLSQMGQVSAQFGRAGNALRDGLVVGCGTTGHKALPITASSFSSKTPSAVRNPLRDRIFRYTSAGIAERPLDGLGASATASSRWG